MTAEIAIRQTGGGMTLPDKITYSKALAESNLLPAQYRKNPANLLFALEYAEALGVAPIHAITSIHVIEGKPSASADLIGTMVRRAGHRLRVSGDDTFALAQIIRADDPGFTFEARWDMNRARAAGLAGKGVWKSYPGAMLRARAITEVARSAAPDALFGVIYSPEELGAEVNAAGDVLAAPSARPEPAQPAASAADRLRAAVRPAPAPEPVAVPVDVATGEVIDAEPAKTTSERAEPLRTEAQSKALHAGLTGLGITNRDTGLAYVSQVIGRDIDSTKTLTRAEASKAIEHIKAEEQQPAAAPPAEDFVEEPPDSWEPSA